MPTSRAVLLCAVLGALLVLAGCGPSAPRPGSSSLSPTSSPSAVTSSWPDCDAFAAIIDGAALIGEPVNGALRLPDGESALSSSPTASSVIDSGGLACQTVEGAAHVSILALADAQQEFDEARTAIEAVPPVADGASRVYAYSEVGAGGFVTCRDTGSGGLCTWSITYDQVWFVFEAYPVPLAELVFPADLPSGWAQPPYPAPGGAVEALVAELAAVASSAPPESPRSPGATSCLDVATPERVLTALGGGSPASQVAEVQPAEVAAAVTSTAGYALPYYAAARAGWSRCEGNWQMGAGELTVVTRPVGEPASPATDGECLGPGDGFEQLCRVVVVVGGEQRIAQFAGPAGVATVDSLTALVS